jgi:UDP-glucuronate 4-epimerase
MALAGPSMRATEGGVDLGPGESTTGCITPRAVVDSRAAIAVTGASGFIGAELCEALCARGIRVVGIDRRDEVGADALVCERLGRLRRYSNFSFIGTDLRATRAVVEALPATGDLSIVHLAAQAGVRHPAPEQTIECNVVATQSLLDVLRRRLPRQLIFASSSSVYGRGAQLPFHEDQTLGTPASLYAQTKAEGEVLTAAFARETGVPTTTLRLFNVYGPRMRDDLVVSIFASRIAVGEPVDVADGGRVLRDMTYVGDVVKVFVALLESPADRHETLNVGTGRMVELTHVLDLLERYLGSRVVRRATKTHECDLPATLADLSRLRARLGRAPETMVEDGLREFANWFLARRTSVKDRGEAVRAPASRESAG